MSRLFRVSCMRLFRSRIFYVALAATLLFSLFICLTKAPQTAEWAETDEDYSLEDCYYDFLPLLGLVFGCFVTVFQGVEYSDGTLRNKLIAGHTRNEVFTSLFLVSALGCAMITIVWMLASLPGLYWFSGFACGWRTFALSTVLCFASAVLYAAIYTTVALLCPNRAVSVVIALVMWFVFLFAGSSVFDILAAPQTIYDMVYIDGSWAAGPEYPNPNYVSGIGRTVLEVLSHIMPSCPVLSLALKMTDAVVTDILCTLGLTLAVLGGGCLGFAKKDLK